MNKIMETVSEHLTRCEVILYLLTLIAETPSEVNPAYIAFASDYALQDVLAAETLLATECKYNYMA